MRNKDGGNLLTRESVESFFETHKDLILRDHDFLKSTIEQRPESVELFFEVLYQNILKSSGNYVYDFLSIISTIISVVASDEVNMFINKLLSISNRDVLQSMIKASFFANLYVRVPKARNQIVDFLVNNSNLDGVYSNLYKIAKEDDTIILICIESIEKDLEDPLLNRQVISDMLTFLGYIKDISAYREKCTTLLEEITKKKSLITTKILRDASRLLGKTEELRSTVMYGKRVPKNKENSIGWEDVTEIPIDEPCVLFFGGDACRNSGAANGYAKDIENLLQSNDIKGVGIYSIYYDFGTDKEFAFNAHAARKILMQQKHRNIGKVNSVSIDDVNPRYVNQIFADLFLPRISKDGKKINMSDAIKNIRNITIVAHCHGAYTFLKLEELMQKKMRELGYSSFESAAIQKQLLCVAYAPYCPLGVSKSTFVSFASVNDDEVNHYNNFESQIREIVKKQDIGISWFPDKLGNVFLVSKMLKNGDDHFFHRFPSDLSSFTDDGKLSIIFQRNAVVNGVKSSIQQTQIPSIKGLVTGADKTLEMEFEQAIHNGNEIYGEILRNVSSSHVKEQ